MRAIAVALLVVGCAHTVRSGGLVVREQEWRLALRELIYRAEAEIGHCATREFQVLGEIKHLPVKVVAQGCGVTAIYEHRARGKITYKHGGAWELAASSRYASTASSH